MGICKLSTLPDGYIVRLAMTQNRAQLVRAYILSAIVVLVAALGSFMNVETASVMLSVPPQKLVATATLTGGTTGGDLKTQRIQATVTEAQGGTASTILVGPTFATGRVVFSCAACGSTDRVEVQAGTIVTNVNSLSYATLAAASVTRARPATVAVRATSTGASWNTGKATVTGINNSPATQLHVTNPSAIVGGSDVHPAQAIQQSDFDAARSALETKVTAALGLALKAKAVEMTYIADGPPVFTVISDRKVGDQVSTFTMTMTGTIGATAFSDSDARALMRSALAAQVPAGQQLTSDPVDITWETQKAGANGGVTVKGSAVGYIAPTLSTNTLRAGIRGFNPAQARRSLERAVPGSSAEIQISPFEVPWLPLIAEHISITVLVQPPGR
jgi:baseplate J-like protein